MNEAKVVQNEQFGINFAVVEKRIVKMLHLEMSARSNKNMKIDTLRVAKACEITHE